MSEPTRLEDLRKFPDYHHEGMQTVTEAEVADALRGKNYIVIRRAELRDIAWRWFMNRYNMLDDDQDDIEDAKDFVSSLLDALAPVQEAIPCDHEWVNARNENVLSGEWCPKCNAVRASVQETTK